jgi:hypothetical protein
VSRLFEWVRERKRTVGAVVGGWFLLWCDWSAWGLLPGWVHGMAFTAYAVAAGWWCWRVRDRSVLERCLVGTIGFVVGWQWLVLMTSDLGWHGAARVFSLVGAATLFLVGLAWLVWTVDRESRRYPEVATAGGGRVWNPVQLGAWYFRAGQRKLDQSLWTMLGYAVLFWLLFLLLTRLPGCRELYEMPAGGGEPRRMQVVKIQKIIEKKIVINPFSSIIFNPPPIEDVKLELQELTKHAYEVGYGAGKGAGFAGGTNRGKVRFIRLEYAGGDWDQDFGVGSDLNMLLEYGIRTGHRVHDRTESRRIGELSNFPERKSPPMVYLTGQKNIIASDREVEVLREYLTDKHGMIFADNGGSGGWHGQFFELMRRVFPTVKPVRVPLDHPVHRVPYEIPFLPYVAPHGGREAWGWVIDGRLAAYYHPGDIGDAWADGHAGVKREIWEYCYQLGTNVIFYAHAEYSKWLESTEPENGAPSPSSPPPEAP